MREVNSLVRSVLAKALLFLVGLAGALLIVETSLRIYNPFYVRIKAGRIVLEGNRKISYSNHTIKQLDPLITVTQNSLGFRGPVPPADFGHHLTFIAIGGSTTHCFMLSDGKTWPERLGKRLEDSFRNVWINIAGLSGHTTFGHIPLLKDYVVTLRPIVVLFLVGLNDVGLARLTEYEAETMKAPIMFDSAKSLLKSLCPYSEVANLLANLYRIFNAYQAGLLTSAVDLEKSGHLNVSAAMEREFAERYSKPYLPAYELRLKRLIDISRGANIEPVLITQPMLVGRAIDDVTKVNLGTIDLTSIWEQQANGEMWWDLVEAFNDVTRKVGRENRLLVIDLARQMPKNSRYFYDYWHFTNEGAEVVAHVVYSSLCPMLAAHYPEYAKRGCESASDRANEPTIRREPQPLGTRPLKRMASPD